jgi:hypothetical protein
MSPLGNINFKFKKAIKIIAKILLILILISFLFLVAMRLFLAYYRRLIREAKKPIRVMIMVTDEKTGKPINGARIYYKKVYTCLDALGYNCPPTLIC